MSIYKCPINCEHDYDFPHSIITTVRTYDVSGNLYQEVRTFVVCRMCSHWIDGNTKCNCKGRCHGQAEGTTVDVNILHDVDLA